jgi:hypothetical protein
MRQLGAIAVTSPQADAWTYMANKSRGHGTSIPLALVVELFP